MLILISVYIASMSFLIFWLFDPNDFPSLILGFLGMLFLFFMR